MANYRGQLPPGPLECVSERTYRIDLRIRPRWRRILRYPRVVWQQHAYGLSWRAAVHCAYLTVRF